MTGPLPGLSGKNGLDRRREVELGAIDMFAGTATAAANAATLNRSAGVITSEALTTAAGSDYALTLTNSMIAAGDMVLASVDNGTNTTEGMAINRVTPSAGAVVIRVRNTHSATGWNGTIKISFLVIKPQVAAL